MTRTRRIVAACATLLVTVLMAGCFPLGRPGPYTNPKTGLVTNEYGVTHSSVEPTAMKYVDGVEVWDLTGPPSPEAFGIDMRSATGSSTVTDAYSSHPARPARFLLPDGVTVEADVTEVIFTLTDNPVEYRDQKTGEVRIPQGRSIELGVDVAMDKGVKQGVATYRGLLRQLDLPDDTAVEMQRKFDDAKNIDPLDAFAGVGVHSPYLTLGTLTVSVGTSFTPDDTDEGFHPVMGIHWDIIPIPTAPSSPSP